jgi:hypothetical protein
MKKQVIKISENKKIFIYDELFHHQDLQDIYAYVEQGEYKRSNLDLVYFNNQSVDYKWSRMIGINDHWFKRVVGIYTDNIDELKHSPFTVERSYINFSTMDTVDMIHCDCLAENTKQFTLLHYANWFWNPNWHGETVFYDDQGQDVVAAVSLKPGRVVFFNGNIPHSAIAPSRISEYPRYTIANKLQFQ